MNKRIEEIKKSFGERTPKQMRTLRNQLNNRIKSYDDEVKFGKKVPNLSESHTLFGLTIGDCKELLTATKSGLKSIKNELYEED